MKIIFNASTNFKGGAVQTAVNFIKRNLAVPNIGIDWYYVVSLKIHRELRALGIQVPDAEIFYDSPARNVRARKRLLQFAEAVNPDIVFTMSGPSYVDFEQKHVLGCSLPFMTHPNKYAWKSFKNPFKKAFFRANLFYKKKWFSCADYWVFQTETSRNGFIDRFRVARDRTIVIPNACSDLYLRSEGVDEQSCEHAYFKILVPSAYYEHKNLEIIPHVAYEVKTNLKEQNMPFRFVFTLPVDDFSKIRYIAASLDVLDHIENRGPFKVAEGPSLYSNCDLMFLPTLLETFSASYLESMAMGLPIVTTDFDFARDICGNAALYFPPNSVSQAADVLVKLIRSKEDREEMVRLGKMQLKKHPTLAERHKAYIDFLLTHCDYC